MREKRIFVLWLSLTVFLISASGQQTAEDWFSKGFALVQQGRYDEAIQAYDKVIELKPDALNLARTWYNKGIALDEQGRVAVPVPQETKLVSEGEAAVEELPAREVAYITVRGPYENLEQVYARLAAWVYQKGYRFADAPREVYMRWGENIPAKDWVTEIQFPIEH